MTVDGKLVKSYYSWVCPVCGQFFKREHNHVAETSLDMARYMLQWDAINHIATHIDCSAPTTKEEIE